MVRLHPRPPCEKRHRKAALFAWLSAGGMAFFCLTSIDFFVFLAHVRGNRSAQGMGAHLLGMEVQCRPKTQHRRTPIPGSVIR